ncbi:MAG: diguanylate cyclase [Halobacteriovoraceae bacterium]|jgi:two-component system, cell cycle response regulator|nr:diguanylate cyclase [Halobacteriovoraceae bacterium]
MSDDNATVVITDIHAALRSADNEAAEKPACFIVVGGDLNGTIFDLLDGETLVGRSADNTIPLEFQGVSRRHFKVIVKDADAHIEDLGSSNGTFVNNKQIEALTKIHKGDMVKLGSIALKYLEKGDTERLTYDKLHEEANTDGLTKCFNKMYFNNKLDLEVKKSKVTGLPLSLIIFDLDHFKHLNDNFGHDAGDYVLKEMAQILRDNGIRKGDTFARYGGEEFVVLLPKTNLKQAFEIAERLRKLVESHPFKYEDQKDRLPVTASIGVADYRQGVEVGTDLFKRADTAVYQAKDSGRNQVSFYKV